MKLLRCLHQALRAILRHPVATLLGIPLLVALAAAGSVALWVGVFFLLLAAPQLLGAVPALALAAVDAKPGERVDWRLFINGFRHYERWLGLFGVAYPVTFALAIPTILAFWLRLRILPESAGDSVLVAGLVVSAALWVAVFHRYVFAPFVAVSCRAANPCSECSTGRKSCSAAEDWRSFRPRWCWWCWACRALAPYGVGLVVTLPLGVCGLASLHRRISSRGARRVVLLRSGHDSRQPPNGRPVLRNYPGNGRCKERLRDTPSPSKGISVFSEQRQ